MLVSMRASLKNSEPQSARETESGIHCSQFSSQDCEPQNEATCSMFLVSVSLTIHGAGIVFPQPTSFRVAHGSHSGSSPLLLLQAVSHQMATGTPEHRKPSLLLSLQPWAGGTPQLQDHISQVIKGPVPGRESTFCQRH